MPYCVVHMYRTYRAQFESHAERYGTSQWGGHDQLASSEWVLSANCAIFCGSANSRSDLAGL